MIKKRVVAILLLTVMLGGTIALVGCKSLDDDAAFAQLQTALTNTLSNNNAHIYYWKEQYSYPRKGNADETFQTKVNVLCTIDRHYDFVKDGDGEYDYDDLKVNIVKLHDNLITEQIYCGYDEDGVSSYVKIPYNDKGKEITDERIFRDTTAEEYVFTPEFQEYTLAAKLAELKAITREDIVIQSTEKKGNVITMTCRLTDEYKTRYETANGKKSVLSGSYFTLETAYDRISSIIVYEPSADSSNLIKMDYESYKLEIVYTGPKFTIPTR